MDAIMDLTSRAVSFITFIQDVYLKGPVLLNQGRFMPFGTENKMGSRLDENLKVYIDAIKEDEKSRINSMARLKQTTIGKQNRRQASALVNKHDSQFYTGIKSRVIELVWLSTRILNEEEANDQAEMRDAEEYVIFICNKLADWINKNFDGLQAIDTTLDSFSSAYTWRKVISRYIYKNSSVEHNVKDDTDAPGEGDRRIKLARALEYIPVQIVLVIGGCKYDATQQRILQWWQINKGQESQDKIIVSKKLSLNDAETSLLEEFVSQEHYYTNVKNLLKNESDLTHGLLKVEAPLSFEYVLHRELDEIAVARQRRRTENNVLEESSQASGAIQDDAPGSLVASQNSSSVKDPFERAATMKTFALAFSGGGIRSATFNLGIIQGLAKADAIKDIDYLSTVSGGGYIGSWLVTWMKRDGSVKKVSDRLNPDKSADPLGEEVRPIRWLRMFSNYLSPNKSIMSVDAWTVGITWLRNTLLNQVMLFFILLSGLMALRAVYELWDYPRLWIDFLKPQFVYILGCLFMAALAFIIGSSMQWYDNANTARLRFNLDGRNRITYLVLVIAGGGTYMVSASMFIQPEATSFLHKLYVLIPAGLATFFILLAVANWGNYYKCIEALEEGGKYQRARSIFIILYTSLIATIAGWLALAAVGELISELRHNILVMPAAKKFLVFCFGPPALLMVFSITVVSRMALLGKYFPDERREWWGRMGAVINRMSFLWILVSLLVSYLLIRDVVKSLLNDWEGAPATIGGWMILVGGTVKAAFNANTSGKDGRKKGFQAVALNLLSLAGPYIFILGLLIFLPRVAEPLLQQTIPWEFLEDRLYLKAIMLALVTFGIGYFLSCRIGVNEFSMHHFYRNRLVRAYLGATRRKANRERTSNPFTSFDKLDDEKLSGFVKETGYYGPYPILNTALNASQVSDLSRQDRKAESFIFSPLYCGFDFSKVRASINSRIKSYDFGYRPTCHYAYPNDNGPAIGTAMAISGAAVNPNQGYHSSPGVAFLLTVFNVSMGWWIGNPRKGAWQRSDPKSGLINILDNLTANTSTRKSFVCLSDGGHFDNMGLYEMIRRRCSLIVLGDGEQDEEFTCEGFANAIRRCRIDFGAEINISTEKIVKRKERLSEMQYAIGSIKYSGEDKASGVLIYIKSSITGKEPVDIAEYAKKNDTFPHQSTGDQFFDEGQFESYRKLGMYIADIAMADEDVIKALQTRSPEHLLAKGASKKDGPSAISYEDD